ncbi:hypothetical protein [Ramlibacter agri]|nr:hypothetical protein [Ramlibacter agri]
MRLLCVLLALAALSGCAFTRDPPLENPVRWGSSPAGIGPQGETP